MEVVLGLATIRELGEALQVVHASRLEKKKSASRQCLTRFLLVL